MLRILTSARGWGAKVRGSNSSVFQLFLQIFNGPRLMVLEQSVLFSETIKKIYASFGLPLEFFGTVRNFSKETF